MSENHRNNNSTIIWNWPIGSRACYIFWQLGPILILTGPSDKSVKTVTKPGKWSKLLLNKENGQNCYQTRKMVKTVTKQGKLLLNKDNFQNLVTPFRNFGFSVMKPKKINMHQMPQWKNRIAELRVICLCITYGIRGQILNHWENNFMRYHSVNIIQWERLHWKCEETHKKISLMMPNTTVAKLRKLLIRSIKTAWK